MEFRILRLVLGWLTGGADPSQPRPLDQPDVLPALAGGGPLGTPWSGPVFYEESPSGLAADNVRRWRALAQQAPGSTAVVVEGVIPGPPGGCWG
jgi:hypothetical protein